MVKVVSLPPSAARYLSDDAISGWASGVQYSPPPKEEPSPTVVEIVTFVPTAIHCGRSLSIKEANHES